MKRKDPLDRPSFGSTLRTKIKEEDRSHDLEVGPQLHPEAPTGATSGRTAKRDPQDESHKGIPERFHLY